MDKLILAFCRLGFAGLSPIMPGTCGSALAAVLAPFLFIPLPFVARIVVLVLVFWIGGMAATRGEQILGYKDPGEIVIDELLGMWLVLLPFSDPGWGENRHCLRLIPYFRYVEAVARPCVRELAARRLRHHDR